MSLSNTQLTRNLGKLLFICLVAGAPILLMPGCGWLPVSSDAIQGEYVAWDTEGDFDPSWRESAIVLRDGSGSLSGAAGTQELSYSLSDQPSPWITLTLADGSSLQLQYRRPGALTYYDRTGGVVHFRRVGR